MGGDFVHSQQKIHLVLMERAGRTWGTKLLRSVASLKPNFVNIFNPQAVTWRNILHDVLDLWFRA